MKLTKSQKQIILGSSIGVLGVGAIVAPVATSLTISKVKVWPEFASDNDVKNGIGLSTYKDMKEQFRISYRNHLVEEELVDDPELIESEMKRADEMIESFDKAFIDYQNDAGAATVDYTTLTSAFSKSAYDFKDLSGKYSHIKLVRLSNAKWDDLTTKFEQMSYQMSIEMRNQGFSDAKIRESLAKSQTRFADELYELMDTCSNDVYEGVQQGTLKVVEVFDELTKTNALITAQNKLNDFINGFDFEVRPDVHLGDPVIRKYKIGDTISAEDVNKIFRITNKATNNSDYVFDPNKMIPGGFPVSCTLYDRYNDNNHKYLAGDQDVEKFGLSTHYSQNRTIEIDFNTYDQGYVLAHPDITEKDKTLITAHVRADSDKENAQQKIKALLSSSNGSSSSEEDVLETINDGDIVPSQYRLNAGDTDNNEGEDGEGIEITDSQELGNEYFNDDILGGIGKLQFSYTGSEPAAAEYFYNQLDKEKSAVRRGSKLIGFEGFITEENIVKSGISFKYGSDQKWNKFEDEYNSIKKKLDTHPSWYENDYANKPLVNFLKNCELFGIVQTGVNIHDKVTVYLCARYDDSVTPTPSWNKDQLENEVKIDANGVASAIGIDNPDEIEVAKQYFWGLNNYKPLNSDTSIDNGGLNVSVPSFTSGAHEEEMVVSSSNNELSFELYENIVYNYNYWNYKMQTITKFDKWLPEAKQIRDWTQAQYWIEFGLYVAGAIVATAHWIADLATPIVWSWVITIVIIGMGAAIEGIKIKQYRKYTLQPLKDVIEKIKAAKDLEIDGVKYFDTVVNVFKKAKELKLPEWDPNTYDFEKEPYSQDLKDGYTYFKGWTGSRQFWDIKSTFIDPFSRTDASVIQIYYTGLVENECDPGTIVGIMKSKGSLSKPYRVAMTTLQILQIALNFILNLPVFKPTTGKIYTVFKGLETCLKWTKTFWKLIKSTLVMCGFNPQFS